MIQYCIEVSLVWTIFYLIYRLFLRKETFFRANRWYLVHTLWVGAAFPYLRAFSLEWTRTDNIIYESVAYIQSGTQTVVETVAISPISQGITVQDILVILYFLGAFITLGRFLHGLGQIAKLYRHGIKEQRDGYTLVMTNSCHLPFSFFKYIFLHPSFLEDENLDQIVSHEYKHISDNHTFDVLFMESFAILFWWNPLMYLYKKEVKQNHEYIADAYASLSSNRKNYGQILLGHSSSGLELALTHQFFNSHLKNRINMLYKKQSARYKMSKYLVLVPFLLFFGILFSSEALQISSESQNEDGIPAASDRQSISASGSSLVQAVALVEEKPSLLPLSLIHI